MRRCRRTIRSRWGGFCLHSVIQRGCRWRTAAQSRPPMSPLLDLASVCARADSTPVLLAGFRLRSRLTCTRSQRHTVRLTMIVRDGCSSTHIMTMALFSAMIRTTPPDPSLYYTPTITQHGTTRRKEISKTIDERKLRLEKYKIFRPPPNVRQTMGILSGPNRRTCD
jgi:hypothetical protein